MAAVISYRHGYEPVSTHGEPGLTARLVPLTVDGLILVASMLTLGVAAQLAIARELNIDRRKVRKIIAQPHKRGAHVRVVTGKAIHERTPGDHSGCHRRDERRGLTGRWRLVGEGSLSVCR